MNVWVIEAKNVNGDRNGIRVYANKEDALADLNRLMMPKQYLENSDEVEYIKKIDEKLYVLGNVDTRSEEYDERAAAVECKVFEEFQE